MISWINIINWFGIGSCVNKVQNILCFEYNPKLVWLIINMMFKHHFKILIWLVKLS
jgi:hypothetical protein